MEQTPNCRVKKQFTLCVPPAILELGIWSVCSMRQYCEWALTGKTVQIRWTEQIWHVRITPDKILSTWQDNHQIGEAVQIWC